MLKNVFYCLISAFDKNFNSQNASMITAVKIFVCLETEKIFCYTMPFKGYVQSFLQRLYFAILKHIKIYGAFIKKRLTYLASKSLKSSIYLYSSSNSSNRFFNTSNSSMLISGLVLKAFKTTCDKIFFFALCFHFRSGVGQQIS